MSIDFLTIGHITHDLTPDGFRLGGTASFAAATALRLGRRPGVLTRGTTEGFRHAGHPARAGWMTGLPDTPLDGASIRLLPSPVSTTFANIYHEGRRTQVVTAVAAPIAPADLPAEWTQTPVVLLGPLVREVPATWMAIFPQALLGITPQGWLRQWDEQGHVSPAVWENADDFIARADAVVLSREDVGGDDRIIADLAARTRLLVATDGWHGATIYTGGEMRHVPPRPANEVDPTGAGDVFTTAFLIRLAETRDAYTAARFANVVASMSIEAPGMAAIPTRAQAEEWLRLHV